MDKFNKISLIIIIILLILLGTMVVLYINANKLVNEYVQKLLYSNTLLTNYVEATENSGLKLKEQEDHSYKFVERAMNIEENDK